MKSIGLWGTVRAARNDGFGYAGLKLVEAFKRQGVNCYWQDETAQIALNFCQPQSFGGAAHQYRIAYTPWESTILPDWWIPILDEMDEIWTTSQFCKKVYNDAGFRDVQVFLHGLDTQEFTLKKHFKSDRFIFLHMGEPASRKNGQLAFDAFRKAFGRKQPNRLYKDSDEIYFVMKSSAWVEARWKDKSGSIIGKVRDYPNCETMEGILTPVQLDSLYQAVSCMVYPSSGEGFGLMPFQAIGCGVPTLMPAYSGMTEFSKYSIPLEFSVGPSEHDYHAGDWAWPDIDDVAETMVWVYENYEAFAEQAYENGKKLRKQFSWDKIVEKMLVRLEPHW